MNLLHMNQYNKLYTLYTTWIYTTTVVGENCFDSFRHNNHIFIITLSNVCMNIKIHYMADKWYWDGDNNTILFYICKTYNAIISKQHSCQSIIHYIQLWWSVVLYPIISAVNVDSSFLEEIFHLLNIAIQCGREKIPFVLMKSMTKKGTARIFCKDNS
jgi:hypothetical protein